MSHIAVDPALLSPSGAEAPAAPAGAPAPRRSDAPGGPTFTEVLGRSAGIKFSGHALQRVERRGIALDGQTLARLDDGVRRAAAKGARESVVFVGGTAFVVSVRNRTVITAVDAQSMRDHVFTNIDSAVIA